MISVQVHQKIVDLLAVATRNIELDLPSIRAHAAPGAVVEEAAIRSLEFSLKLLTEAAELAEGSPVMRVAILERCAAIEATIVLCRQNIDLWLSQAESRNATKH